MSMFIFEFFLGELHSNEIVELKFHQTIGVKNFQFRYTMCPKAEY